MVLVSTAPSAARRCSVRLLSGLALMRAWCEGSTPPRYNTDFTDRSAILAMWTPQEQCAHCSKKGWPEVSGGTDECTNMTASATTFGPGGMTHTTVALPRGTPTSCQTQKPVCSSGHLTWDPLVLYGNFSVDARWFPGDKSGTSTGFIGLDSDGNQGSITMGFHGSGWLGGEGEGPHKYQHGIYSDVRQSHNRQYTTTQGDISTTFHRYGLLWTPRLVEWRLNGAVVRRVTDTTIIPYQHMQFRLHTRSGYCDKMPTASTFNATFR
jgi:hypothetical protein